MGFLTLDVLIEVYVSAPERFSSVGPPKGPVSLWDGMSVNNVPLSASEVLLRSAWRVPAPGARALGGPAPRGWHVFEDLARTARRGAQPAQRRPGSRAFPALAGEKEAEWGVCLCGRRRGEC